MPAPESIQASAWAVYFLIAGGAVCLCFGVGVYGLIARQVARNGGKVKASDFGLPELLMTLVLAGTFLLLMVSAIQRQAKGEAEVKIENVLPSSLIFVVLALGIAGFLQFARRLPVISLFGLNRVGPLKLVGWISGLFVATLPITSAVGWLTKQVLKDDFASQPLVELFSHVARQKDYYAVAKIFFVGAFLAPCCEEFLFRGFFYGIWKRYLGPLGAGLLACTLFAALHTSLSSFPTLFVLAICLNLAYERTGSLLVPIGLHALFNFLSLLVLYAMTRFPNLPVPP